MAIHFFRRHAGFSLRAAAVVSGPETGTGSGQESADAMCKTEKLDTTVRRGQIAEAALQVAAAEGVAGITVKKVADRVGLTPSGLYRHYKDKGEIIDAMVAWVHERFQANITAAEAEADNALDVMRSVILRNLRTVRRYSIMPLIFLSSTVWTEQPRLAERVRANIRHSLGRFAGILARGQRAGQIRNDESPECLAVAFIGAYSTPALLHVRGLTDADLDSLVDTNWRLLRAALEPRN